MSKMSLPHNLKPSPHFVNCGEGRSRQLLFYEASVMEVMKGPMTMMSSTIGNMIQYMLLKAQTPEEKLLVKMLSEKVMAEYLASVGGMMLILDNNLDVKGEIEKAITECLKKKTPSVPQPEPVD